MWRRGERETGPLATEKGDTTMDITRAYMEQSRKNESNVTLPSGEGLPVTTIQPGLRVSSRIFLRADNVPEFYVSLSDPIPEETALLVMPDGRAVFVPAARIEDAGLDKELPPAGVPFFSTFYPISDMPRERLALTKPIPKGKLLMAGSLGRAVMVELLVDVSSVTTGETPEDGPLFLAACSLANPRTREIIVSSPPRPSSPDGLS